VVNAEPEAIFSQQFCC